MPTDCIKGIQKIHRWPNIPQRHGRGEKTTHRTLSTFWFENFIAWLSGNVDPVEQKKRSAKPMVSMVCHIVPASLYSKNTVVYLLRFLKTKYVIFALSLSLWNSTISVLFQLHFCFYNVSQRSHLLGSGQKKRVFFADRPRERERDVKCQFSKNVLKFYTFHSVIPRVFHWNKKRNKVYEMYIFG